MKSIPYGRQNIDDEDCASVTKALRGDFLTQGPSTLNFEKDFAEFVGSKFAVAVSSGTAALHLAFLSLNVKAGSKVIVPGNTFAASANAVLYCGGEVEFAEINLETGCIDLDWLELRLSRAAVGEFVGVVAVDYAGFPVDLERLQKISKAKGLWVVEDACHAPGARFLCKSGVWSKSGSCDWANAATFSFHPVKHITTGEGGMVTTNDEAIYRKLLLLRTHGITKAQEDFQENEEGAWYHEMQELGFNYRLSDINCALGISQLKKLPWSLARRRAIAKTYLAEFVNLEIFPQAERDEIENAYHLFTVRSSRRGQLFNFLHENGIKCQVHYLPVYRHPYYQKRYGKIVRTANDQFYEQIISLPMYPTLKEDELNFVIDQVKMFFK